MNKSLNLYRLIHLCAAVMILAASAVFANETGYDFIVAKDGSGDFTTIQQAIDASKAFPDKRISIFIKDGVYQEKVNVPSWNPKISLIGESREKTIISFDDHFEKIDRGRNSTFHTYTLQVQGNDFYAKNLTIQNTAGEVGQAVVLHVEADRAVFVNCSILGNQDTVYVAGEGARQYFRDCYIEGTTDFIFGEATAVFDHCTIHSKKDSYITAASTPDGIDFGLVFRNCELTADTEIDQVFLGRPWRDHAKTVFIKTEMGAHILAHGWHDWDKKNAQQTVFYAEHENSGPGYTPGERVEWSFQLNEKQAANYTLNQIFKGWEPLKAETNQVNKEEQ